MKTDSLPAALALLGQQNPPEDWHVYWAEAEAGWEGNREGFLQPAKILLAAERLRFPEDLRAALRDGFALFEEHPSTLRLAWQCHAQLIKAADVRGQPEQWSTLPPTLHAAAPLFPIYILLSGLEEICARHRARGIPEAVTLATLSDLLLWIRHYREQNGRWGLAQLGWLSRHFTGSLFALGRLQFAFESFPYGFRAYRRREDGEERLVCDDGLAFRQDGQFADADGQSCGASWRSELRETPQETVAAFVDTQRGAVQRETIRLRHAEWECALGEGDPVLGVHIPATGPLDHDACTGAFAEAAGFFALHFPDRPFRAYTCTSWLLDPQLGDVLPPTAGIVRFLRRWRLHPVPGANACQTYERVFGNADLVDLSGAPRSSSLQKAIVRHVENGGHWRLGGGVILP